MGDARAEQVEQGYQVNQPRRSSGGLTPFPGRPDPAAAEPPEPPRSAPAEPLDNLPLQLTRFVGRTEALVQLRTLLGGERLLTLTGPGGIGKTRLALEAASQVRADYPDGVWLVELAALAEPTLVLQAVAAPLGIRAVAQASLQSILLDVLKSRQLLLVLDNCEHLVQACAEVAEALLRGCPGLRILATSREPLRVPGETAWRVPPLGLPDASAPSAPAELLESEAARLFVDRAQRAAGFRLDEQNAPVVAQLCQQLDGIPLAIELAAARTGALSVEQIAARLDDRFRLLIGGSRTAPARQQTLRATIDWSYDLLTPAEQRLLGRLSVFAGGWTLEAAERVCGGDGIAPDDLLDLLARLVDKSLVLTEPGSGGQLRYGLLESVRHYGQERLQQAGEAPSSQQRHFAYYAELAAAVESHVVWGAEDVAWRARLDLEQPNLRAALAWSLSPAGNTADGLALAGHLGHFWYTRGDRAEGRAWLAQVLERATDEPSPSPAARAWALLWAGGLAHGQSQYAEAVDVLEQALGAFEQLADRRGIGLALSFLGHVARARADLDQAVGFLERAVAAFRALGDPLSVISPLSALGFTHSVRGDHDQAMALLEESVALAQQSGSNGRLAIASLYLAQVAFARGDTRRAAAVWEAGLQLALEWGSLWGLAECLEGLAMIAGADGRPGRAARLLGAAARLRASIGAPAHPVDRADHDRTLAATQTALGGRAFATAWADGQAMRLNQVVDYALGTLGASERAAAQPEPALDDPSQPASRLTQREREVAALIARGLTNRQIAEQLVIAERTVTNHVEHILNKLGFHTRTQVATWFTAQQRPPGEDPTR